jgi:uncharacterized SAM-binding protein YcdF (DUF218 family)
MLRVVEVFLLPPLLPLLLLAAACLIRRRFRRVGLAGIAAAGLLLVGSSLPIAGVALLRTLQRAPALDLAHLPPAAEAIVVLSADMDVDAPEYGGQTPGPLTLQRLRYAAAVHEATGLPLLVAGGQLPGHTEAHATTMQRVLEDDFGVRVRWCEAGSRTTAENARESAGILRAAGIERVFLVTHAWHMPRAAACFARRGIAVVAAPTAFARWPRDPWVAWLPRWSGQRDVALALHEWLGRAYYALVD